MQTGLRAVHVIQHNFINFMDAVDKLWVRALKVLQEAMVDIASHAINPALILVIYSIGNWHLSYYHFGPKTQFIHVIYLPVPLKWHFISTAVSEKIRDGQAQTDGKWELFFPVVSNSFCCAHKLHVWQSFPAISSNLLKQCAEVCVCVSLCEVG